MVSVKAWSNGSPLPSGAGYGLRVSVVDRDQYFEPRWTCVVIDLGAHGRVAVPVSGSFWRTCTELRSAAIGRWLIAHGLAPWAKGSPPHLELSQVHGNQFRLTASP
jgi:hypothetical protein